MNELQELEQELEIAIKHNLDKREVENLQRLISIEKVKNQREQAKRKGLQRFYKLRKLWKR